MIDSARAAQMTTHRNRLRLHWPDADPMNAARWLINGYPATILVWTAEEWAKLTIHPPDAQQVSNGTWCVLRMD